MSVNTQDLGPPPSRSDNIDFVREFYAKRILELSLKNYDSQINRELEKPRVSAPPLQATALAQMRVSAAVDLRSEHAAETPLGVAVEAFSYLSIAPKLPELEGSNEFTIGILGAGVAGLYTALMIESLGPDSGITYQILEANERIGGRLYTHKFEGSTCTPDDYYDVGAMRFPYIPPQQHTFDLFNYLGISDKLIPYVMENKQNDILYFNGKPMTVAEFDTSSAADPFATQSDIDPKVAAARRKDALHPFKEKLKADFDAGWEFLMAQDKHSMRTYLSFVKHVPEPMINWLETFDDSTASYDRAFSETVMDSLIFDYDDDPEVSRVKWYALHGGTKVLVDALLARIQTQPEIRKRVTALSIDFRPKPQRPRVAVTVSQEAQPRVYDHVVSTLPFGCLRLVDTSGCLMPFKLQQAIQTLQYGPSVKVAMRFASRWWETAENQNHKGGVSKTDRPTRIVVYPSYGIGTEASTMIVSYTWTQDALRNAAFVKGSVADQVLRDSILKDLARMHNLEYEWLVEQYVDHHAWSWDHSEFAAGAFALFGPNQFKNVYPEVTTPLHEAVYFAGEACSVYHAWVVGALDSAYKSLFQILQGRGRLDLVERLSKIWRGSEVPGEDEKIAVKQIIVSRFESKHLKREMLSG